VYSVSCKYISYLYTLSYNIYSVLIYIYIIYRVLELLRCVSRLREVAVIMFHIYIHYRITYLLLLVFVIYIVRDYISETCCAQLAHDLSDLKHAALI